MADNMATLVGGGRGLGRKCMPDCVAFDAATSGLGGIPVRDKQPPAAGAALREARAAAASAAAAFEAADGVEDDGADARAMSSTARA